jgi:organic hydroperoxide reductase OsmC/OhrA
MLEFPHHYTVKAAAGQTGDVALGTTGVPPLPSASPVQFDGPGDRWSPETLLVGAVGDCFILTFRAIARASKLPWSSLTCEVTGTLERVERVTQFTGFDLRARLETPPGADAALARRALEKAEQNCLISNSLKASVHLVVEMAVVEEPAVA